MQGRRRLFLEANPLAHLLELVRQPLLGRAPSAEHWIYSLVFMGVLAVIALVMMVFFRRRVVFWL